MVALLLADPQAAGASQTCGTSNGHTVCFVNPPASLTGEVTIQITSSPNKDKMIYQWVPDVGPTIELMTSWQSNPLTNDYSFVWPTEKYLDGSGLLRVRSGSPSATPVGVRVTLSNGNTTDFQHEPSDWSRYLPGGGSGPPDPWTSGSDPVIAAVGDGVSGRSTPEAVVASIQAQSPSMLLYLGDVYEVGTPTEYRNHSGQPDIGGAQGTTWGKLWSITQSVIGNHEYPSRQNWDDYWHQHDEYYAFTFAKTLFIGLSSSAAITSGSAQYQFVQNVLSTNTLPCVVAFWHIPALLNSTQNPGVITNKSVVWKLLTDNGGDIVLNGHVHTMIEYLPMNDRLQLPSKSEPTMVQLVSGAGGPETSVGDSTPDARIAWAKARTPGAVFLTLNGAAHGGTPTSISWTWRDTSGTVLHSSTRTC
jgi:hypothetical protein